MLPQSRLPCGTLSAGPTHSSKTHLLTGSELGRDKGQDDSDPVQFVERAMRWVGTVSVTPVFRSELKVGEGALQSEASTHSVDPEDPDSQLPPSAGHAKPGAQGPTCPLSCCPRKEAWGFSPMSFYPISLPACGQMQTRWLPPLPAPLVIRPQQLPAQRSARNRGGGRDPRRGCRQRSGAGLWLPSPALVLLPGGDLFLEPTAGLAPRAPPCCSCLSSSGQL